MQIPVFLRKIMTLFVVYYFIILSLTCFSAYAGEKTDCSKPGFLPNADGECVCIDRSYAGLISCDFENGTFTASVISGTWIGNYSKGGEDKILAGISQFLLYTDNDSTPLPSNWEELRNGNYLCEPFHREGVLCGSCQFGYSQAVNSYSCVKCSGSDAVANWFLYLALEFLPMTAFFAALLFFDIRTTSGPGTAFIFYAQMINTCFDIGLDNVLGLKPGLQSLMLTYKIPYGIWNLQFFSILARPFCLLPGMDYYGILLISYLSAFYPLLLILIVTLLVRLYDCGYKPIIYLFRPLHRCLALSQRLGKFRASAISAFAVFLVLCYTEVVFIAFDVFSINYLYDSNGDIVANDLPYYDSTISFSSPAMVGLCIGTGLLLLVFGLIFPVILLLPSLLQLAYRITKWDRFAYWMPWGRMQEFLQQFHGCYRDGTSGEDHEYNVYNDRRFFSSFFLFLRPIMFSVYAFTPNNIYQYSIQTVFCLLMIFLIAVLRPFKKNRDNVLNIGAFCLLGTMSALLAFNYFEIISKDLSIPLLICQYILTLSPLVIVGVYFTIKLMKKLSIVNKCKNKARKMKRSMKGMVSASHSNCNVNASTSRDIYSHIDNEDMTEEELDKDLPDFLDYTEATGRLRERDSLWQVINEDEEEVKDGEGRKLLSITEATSYGTVVSN